MIAPTPVDSIIEDENPVRIGQMNASNVFLFVTIPGLRRSVRSRLLSAPIETWRPALRRLRFAEHEP